MLFCTNCGAELPDDAEFCTSCGVKAEPAAQNGSEFDEALTSTPNMETPEPAPEPQPQPSAQPVVKPVAATPAREVVQIDNRPATPAYHVPVQAAAPMYAPYVKPTKPEGFITTGGWIGIIFLTLFPVVNLFFLIAWALGGCSKKQKVTYARAALVVLFTVLLLTALLLMITVMLFNYHGWSFHFTNGFDGFSFNYAPVFGGR